jgi:hypothetical protein
MDWIFGYTAAGGGPAVFSVWNCYNRVNVDTQILMTNSSWSLGAGAPGVFAPAAGGSPNMRCSFITGLEEESFEAKYSVTCVATAGAGCSCGIGYDNISAFTYGVAGFAGISNGSPIVGAFAGVAVLGWHFVQAMEHSDSNPGSFYGTLGLPQVQSGMSVSLRM